MGRVITDGMTLTKAREASPGVLPAQPTWHQLEPNSISAFGTTISTTVRAPISKSRARRRGKVTDLDSAVSFEADLTMQHIRAHAEEFCFARAIGAPYFSPSAAASTGTPGYVVPSLSAAQAALLFANSGSGTGTLLYARGFVNPVNNGIKLFSAAPAAGDTTLQVAGLVAETLAASTAAEVAVAGYRAGAGDLGIDGDGNLLSKSTSFVALGIAVGQVIHVGGVDLAHRFAHANNFGFARVLAVAGNKLTLSKRDQPFTADDGTSTGAGGAAIQIDLLFGQFVRNVDVGSADYVEYTSQFELASPNLLDGGATGYEYAIGNYANEMTIAIPLTGKATVTLGYIGYNTLPPTALRATNAAVAKVGGREESFGTASDIARIRLQDVDETGLTTDFKSASFSLKNGDTAEKVLGRLGPRYINLGILNVDLTNQMLFTNALVLDRIRLNKVTGYDTALRNGDGGFVLDLPTGTMSGGGREYPANQSVLLNDVFQAYQDDAYGYTVGFSFFPVLPAPTA
jgi:hypothetical protein